MKIIPEEIITSAVVAYAAPDNRKSLSDVVISIASNAALQSFFYKEYTSIFYVCPAILTWYDNRSKGGKIEIGEIYMDNGERIEIVHIIYDAEIWLNRNIANLLLRADRCVLAMQISVLSDITADIAPSI